MNFQQIKLSQIRVNKDNDRHGATGSETEAIAWLFDTHGDKMLKLGNDIATAKRIFDAPLVKPTKNGEYVVFDGNRRVTCLKLLSNPSLAPEKYRTAFRKFSNEFEIDRSYGVTCQVEVDQEQIDIAISRRHNGTDGGRGQLNWDTRAKANHANRTGGTNQYPIAEAVESFLKEEGFPEADRIGRSTLFRLLSAKKRQSRFGISLSDGNGLNLNRPKEEVFHLLSKVATDILDKKLTLKNLLDAEGTDKYLQSLEEYGLGAESPDAPKPKEPADTKDTPTPRKKRETLIPNYVNYEIQWQPRQGKVERLWNELRSTLFLSRHELAIPITFRALIELVTKHLMSAKGIKDKGKLGKNIMASANWLKSNGLLNSKEYEDLERAVNDDKSLRALEALHRVVHSSTVSLSKNDKIALWDSFEPYILKCIENG